MFSSVPLSWVFLLPVWSSDGDRPPLEAMCPDVAGYDWLSVRAPSLLVFGFLAVALVTPRHKETAGPPASSETETV